MSIIRSLWTSILPASGHEAHQGARANADVRPEYSETLSYSEHQWPRGSSLTFDEMTRRQLSLFVSGSVSERLEHVRRVVDPVQAALIPAHVTLCREDEIGGADVGLLATQIASAAPIRLVFDKVERFSGRGIWLRIGDGQHAFSELRRQILGASQARDLVPHLTLAHPRNPKARGNCIEAVDLALPLVSVFNRVMLIEQLAPGERWTVLSEMPFADSHRPNQALSPLPP